MLQKRDSYEEEPQRHTAIKGGTLQGDTRFMDKKSECD